MREQNFCFAFFFFFAFVSSTPHPSPLTPKNQKTPTFRWPPHPLLLPPPPLPPRSERWHTLSRDPRSKRWMPSARAPLPRAWYSSARLRTAHTISTAFARRSRGASSPSTTSRRFGEHFTLPPGGSVCAGEDAPDLVDLAQVIPAAPYPQNPHLFPSTSRASLPPAPKTTHTASRQTGRTPAPSTAGSAACPFRVPPPGRRRRRR